MASRIATAPRVTSVVVHPKSTAGEHYRAARKAEVRAGGFPPAPGADLHFYGGRTVEHLTFTNIYLGGKAAWHADDVQKIDHALAKAMSDRRLNNVVAQYYADEKPTTTFKPSRFLEGPLPTRAYRDTIEGFVAQLEAENALAGFPLDSSIFNFLLPSGVVLVDGSSTSHQEAFHHREPEEHDGDEDEKIEFNPALREQDEAADSRHGLGGYHGSIHPKHGAQTETLYYAVGVYSEHKSGRDNGIVAFDKPWKNVCATFYHEMCEMRTDPDVEDAIRAGDTPAGARFLGWYSQQAGEIGDIPMEEAGNRLDLVMKEVPLADGSGTVPIQLMWSNAVHGPEGPTNPHPPANRTIPRS